jgi:hypothetical protein
MCVLPTLDCVSWATTIICSVVQLRTKHKSHPAWLQSKILFPAFTLTRYKEARNVKWSSLMYHTQCIQMPSENGGGVGWFVKLLSLKNSRKQDVICWNLYIEWRLIHIIKSYCLQSVGEILNCSCGCDRASRFNIMAVCLCKQCRSVTTDKAFSTFY